MLSIVYVCVWQQHRRHAACQWPDMRGDWLYCVVLNFNNVCFDLHGMPERVTSGQQRLGCSPCAAVILAVLKALVDPVLPGGLLEGLEGKGG